MYNKHIMPNRSIITRLIPHSASAEEVRIYGVREIAHSKFFDEPYCLPSQDRYYTDPEELLKDYPDINPTIYDFDNKLQPWQT